MARKDRSLAERTYKAGILSGGAAYKISPMAMITEQMKRDSKKAESDPEGKDKDS